MRTTSKTLISFALLLAIAAPPALAQRRASYSDSSFRFRIGLFEPDGDSEYWQFGELDNPNISVFTGEAQDFDDVLLGIDYVRYLGPRLGFMLSAGAWEGEEDQAYLFFEDQFGGDILHRTTLEVGHVTAGLLYNLFDRNRRVVPYVGIGGGVYAWNLTEAGDFIDFTTAPLEIFSTRFEDDGATLGWYWLAGLRIGLTRDWSFFGEIRNHQAEGDLSGDFAGFGKLDLSGSEISGGLSWNL